MPRLLALVAALVVTLLVVTVLGFLIVWAFGTVGRWLIDNAARFQALYAESAAWLEGHGIVVTSLLAENFNAGWLIRAVQEIGGRMYGLVAFVVITFVFTALGLLEVEIARKNIEILDNKEIAQTILQAGTQIAGKFQKYMLVRSVNERADRHGGLGLCAAGRPRTGDGVGRDRVRPELHPVHRTAGRNRVSDPIRARAVRLLGAGRRRVPGPQPDPVPDRQLS